MRIGPFEIGLSRRSQEPTWDTWKSLPFFGYGRTASGVTVTAETPISHHTVFSCFNVIAEGVAMMPMIPYRERGPNRRAAIEHPLYDLLTLAPNPRMSAVAFWKLVLFEKLHYGNHYSLIDRDGTGRIVALYPIENGRVQPFWYRDPATGRYARAYRVSTQEGRMAVFLEDELFHVQNLPILRGPDYGLYGLSVWRLYQSETIGGALAVEEAANATLANGAMMPGFISLDTPLNEQVSKDVRQQIKEEYGGPVNAGKLGVFGHGATFQKMIMTNEEAQQIETRKFNRSVIAGILRVTAHLINDLEKGTFSNIEHLDLAHYKHCLYPHLADICQTAAKDLLTPEERRSLYFEHDPTVMLLGDQKTLGEVLRNAVQSARMTPNEARAIDNRPPLPGGDELYINAASVPVRLAAEGRTLTAGKAAAKPPATDPKELVDGDPAAE